MTIRFVDITFHDLFEKDLKEFSLLFGNGFVMSYPDSSVAEKFLISNEEYADILNKLFNKITQRLPARSW